MSQPDRDTAAYALHFATQYETSEEGVEGSWFFRGFLALCGIASEEELDRLSLSFPDYVAAWRLTRTPDGIDILRQLAHPTQT